MGSYSSRGALCSESDGDGAGRHCKIVVMTDDAVKQERERRIIESARKQSDLFPLGTGPGIAREMIRQSRTKNQTSVSGTRIDFR